MMKIYILLSLAFVSGTALAAWEPDAQELKSLPPFCTPKILNNDPAHVGAQFGEGWGHMHHYCYGLNFINRYYRSRDAAFKKFSLKNAIGNFDYMLDHTSENYFMRGQFLLEKGRVMILMGNKPQGLGEVLRALSYDPTLEAGYRFLADYYSELGKKDEALKWATTGLKHIPGSKSLQRRYKELGGKEPFPEPINKPDPQVVQAPQVKGDESNVDTLTQNHIQAEVQPESNPASPKLESTQETAAPKIGSPKNPFCRFCPD